MNITNALSEIPRETVAVLIAWGCGDSGGGDCGGTALNFGKLILILPRNGKEIPSITFSTASCADRNAFIRLFKP
jgi:hypothetical protein